MSKKLLSEIIQFQVETGLSDYLIGFEAVKNGRLVDRLRNGGRVWPETAERVIEFINNERLKRTGV